MEYQRTEFERILNTETIISLHYFPYTKDFSFPGETHDFWELILVESGEVTVFDRKSVVVKAGEGFLHAPNHYHNIRSNGVFSNITIFTFDCDAKALYGCASKFQVTPLMKTMARVIMEEMKNSLSGPLDLLYQERLNFRKDVPLGARQMIRSALEMILLDLLRRHDGKPLAQKTNRTLADQIAEVLRSNVDKKITLEELSRLLGYCQTHLKRVFRSEYGTSIGQYFLLLKTTEAKKLLSTREYTVTQTAEALGFSNVQYFSAFFRAHTNMTPTQYLSACRGLI